MKTCDDYIKQLNAYRKHFGGITLSVTEIKDDWAMQPARVRASYVIHLTDHCILAGVPLND